MKVEVDRKEAIEYALSLTAANDVVLIAGKGHENYQIIGNTKVPFDDKEIVLEWIKKQI
jgi:UDP-N-acetylmuramoyl-L-alanyl-D-glutamate--2,6-diaminopimelate ligase